MALPAVNSVLECTNFTATVLPFVPQLFELPEKLVQSYSNLDELRNIYLATNPLITAFAFSLFISLLCFIIAEVNRNWSQVDRLWAILPTIYNAHYCVYAHMSGVPSPRLDNLLACSVVWSIRLFYNYFRKGGYNIGSEDYRWHVLRTMISPTQFFIFNVIFISLGQNILLWLITTPTYILLLVDKLDVEIARVDNVIPRIFLGLILLEWFADQQQWDFQEAKKSYLKTAKVPFKFDQVDLDRGFIVTGLWSYSRHPNFAAEQAIWITLYQWSCFATGTIANWSAASAISYVILFQASTWFTERITKKKYPEYEEYQARVAKFLPRLSSKLPGDFSDQKSKPKVETDAGKPAVGNPTVAAPKKTTKSTRK